MRTKILLLLAIIFCVALTVNAQIDTGRFLIGGSINYYHSTNESYNSLYTNIQIGKVIKDNSVVGISLSYSTNNSSSTTNKLRQYSAGVFYRKYKSLGKDFYLFGELDASYQYSNNVITFFQNANQSYYANSNGVTINFIPGISYAMCKRLQIELSMPNLATISYYHAKTIDSGLQPGTVPQKRDSFYANASLNTSLLSNFGIGFKFLLGKSIFFSLTS